MGELPLECNIEINRVLLNHIRYNCEKLIIKSQDSDNPAPVKPDWASFPCHLSEFILHNSLTQNETLLLLLALTPHLKPDFFDLAFREILPDSGNYPQIGGVRGKDFRGFLPTGETAVFLLAGDDPLRRFEVQRYFMADHLFAKQRVLWLKEPEEGEPLMSGRIIMNQEFVELFTLGKVSPPQFSMRFPAQLVETELEWADLVLPETTLLQIAELEVWLKHADALMNGWEMHRKLKPGYRVLFHGPPGTGKTLTAGLLGKYTGRQVFKIDLSMVVSKFIGETEKNLANLFARAENKDWILFFDEADALFGKRTNVRDAHDKYANQEVSYLLQRVETYNGLVILASNFKSNIDEAFIRRFQSVVHFPMPQAAERLRLWQRAFPSQVRLDKNVNMELIVQKYELNGSNIMNIVQFACLQALEKQTSIITQEMLSEGVRREYFKGGEML